MPSSNEGYAILQIFDILEFDALVDVVRSVTKSDPSAAFARNGGIVPGLLVPVFAHTKFTKSTNITGLESVTINLCPA